MSLAQSRLPNLSLRGRPRSLVVALAVLACTGALGCADLPSIPPPAETHLTASFPTQAPRILAAATTLTATPTAFTLTTPRPDPRRLTPTLPRRAEGPIELQLGTFGIRVRELDAAGEGAMAGSAVAYPRAGGTSFWNATTDGVEEWLHLEAGAAQTTQPAAAWQIEGGSLRQAGSAIMVLDEAGAPRIRVTAPEAFAASGRAVTPRLAVSGARIELWLDAGGEDVLVDPVWEPAGTMTASRDFHTATLLPGGDVLVTGGLGAIGGIQTSCERYDPTTSSWSPVAPMVTPRNQHTATLLLTGQVLVAGGQKQTAVSPQETQLAARYYPPTDSWTSTPPMNKGRYGHTATLLPSGRVLVAGGFFDNHNAVATAEIYDPAANTWTSVHNLNKYRGSHTATLLQNGKVLAVGSTLLSGAGTAEVYDPAADTWTLVAPLSDARVRHTATLLPDGTVLVAGGIFGNSILGSAERYDPVADAWSSAGAMSFARTDHQSVLLDNGTVLVTGGIGALVSYTPNAEIYDPATNAWSFAPPMLTGRSAHAATVLADGSVLISGGVTTSGITAKAERYRFGYLGDTCTTAKDCGDGPCVDGVCCDSPCDAGPCDACSVAAGADADGTCKLFTGPACDDGSACTQVDTCQSGVCTGASPSTCSALDECHDPGTCDPATGVCSDLPKPDGSVCDDANPCTQVDACQSGVCTGASPVVCSALDECHDPGTCDPTTGVCSDPPKPDGEPCSMGTCSAGVCMGSSSSSSSSGGGSGGSGGVGGGGGGSGGTSSIGGAGGEGGQGSSSSSSGGGESYRFGGCGCGVAGSGGGQGALVAGLMALGLVARRRRSQVATRR